MKDYPDILSRTTEMVKENMRPVSIDMRYRWHEADNAILKPIDEEYIKLLVPSACKN